jgi:hypothetical protein
VTRRGRGVLAAGQIAFVVNFTKALSLEILNTVLARADYVIEWWGCLIAAETSSINSLRDTAGCMVEVGFKRAAVAVARKRAVIMHAMLRTGELFNPNAGAAA